MPRTKYGQQELPESSSRYYIFLTVSQNLERKRSYVFSRCASLMSRFFIYNVTLMFLRVSSTLLQYQVCVSNFNFLNSRSSNRPNTPFSLGSQANFFFVQAFFLCSSLYFNPQCGRIQWPFNYFCPPVMKLDKWLYLEDVHGVDKVWVTCTLQQINLSEP